MLLRRSLCVYISSYLSWLNKNSCFVVSAGGMTNLKHLSTRRYLDTRSHMAAECYRWPLRAESEISIQFLSWSPWFSLYIPAFPLSSREGGILHLTSTNLTCTSLCSASLQRRYPIYIYVRYKYLPIWMWLLSSFLQRDGCYQHPERDPVIMNALQTWGLEIWIISEFNKLGRSIQKDHHRYGRSRIQRLIVSVQPNRHNKS